MGLPMLQRDWGADHHDLATNQDHIIHWEVLPRGARLSYIDFDLMLTGNEDVEVPNYYMVQLACHWIPAFGTDAAQVVENLANLKILWDKWAVKVDDTTPYSNYSEAGDNTDFEQGFRDIQLFYRPDRISLKTLTNPVEPAVLYNRRIKLGWGYGTAYRTGSGTNVRYQTNIQGGVQSGVTAMTPGYVIWTLTTPPEMTNAVFANTIPSGREFQELDFLAPVMDPINLRTTTGHGDLNAWRRWAIAYYQSDTDNEKWKPSKLHAVMLGHSLYARHSMGNQGTVAPMPVS